MKKILALLLSFVMLVGMVPVQAFATEATTETEAVNEDTQQRPKQGDDRPCRHD